MDVDTEQPALVLIDCSISHATQGRWYVSWPTSTTVTLVPFIFSRRRRAISCGHGEGQGGGRPPHRARARPHLEEALAASQRGTLLFAGPTGEMYRRDVGADDVLRRAMARAGIVIGYEHRCRRHHCGFRELRASAEQDRCPKCRYQLWAKPIPRHVRFHDLRHTTATLLLKEGVSLATVQWVLRHYDPELTTAIYGHLDIADARAALDRRTFEETPATPWSEVRTLG